MGPKPLNKMSSLAGGLVSAVKTYTRPFVNGTHRFFYPEKHLPEDQVGFSTPTSGVGEEFELSSPSDNGDNQNTSHSNDPDLSDDPPIIGGTGASKQRSRWKVPTDIDEPGSEEQETTDFQASPPNEASDPLTASTKSTHHTLEYLRKCSKKNIGGKEYAEVDKDFFEDKTLKVLISTEVFIENNLLKKHLPKIFKFLSQTQRDEFFTRQDTLLKNKAKEIYERFTKHGGITYADFKAIDFVVKSSNQQNRFDDIDTLDSGELSLLLINVWKQLALGLEEMVRSFTGEGSFSYQAEVNADGKLTEAERTGALRRRSFLVATAASVASLATLSGFRYNNSLRDFALDFLRRSVTTDKKLLATRSSSSKYIPNSAFIKILNNAANGIFKDVKAMDLEAIKTYLLRSPSLIGPLYLADKKNIVRNRDKILKWDGKSDLKPETLLEDFSIFEKKLLEDYANKFGFKGEDRQIRALQSLIKYQNLLHLSSLELFNPKNPDKKELLKEYLNKIGSKKIDLIVQDQKRLLGDNFDTELEIEKACISHSDLNWEISEDDYELLTKFLALKNLNNFNELLRLRRFYLEEIDQIEIANLEDTDKRPESINVAPLAFLVVDFLDSNSKFNQSEAENALKQHLIELEKRESLKDPSIVRTLSNIASSRAQKIVSTHYSDSTLPKLDETILKKALNLLALKNALKEKREKASGDYNVFLNILDSKSKDYREDKALLEQKKAELTNGVIKNKDQRFYDTALEAVSSLLLTQEITKFQISREKIKLIEKKAKSLASAAGKRLEFLKQARKNNDDQYDHILPEPPVLGLYDLKELDDSSTFAEKTLDVFDEFDFSFDTLPQKQARSKSERLDSQPIVLINRSTLDQISGHLGFDSIQRPSSFRANSKKGQLMSNFLASYIELELRYLLDQSSTTNSNVNKIVSNLDLTSEQISQILEDNQSSYQSSNSTRSRQEELNTRYYLDSRNNSVTRYFLDAIKEKPEIFTSEMIANMRVKKYLKDLDKHDITMSTNTRFTSVD